MKIEFLEQRRTKGIQGFGVSINNLVDEEAHYYAPKNKKYYVTFNKEEVLNEILKYSYKVVGKKFYAIRYDYEIKNWDFDFNMIISIYKNDYGQDPLTIYIIFNIEWEYWNKPYSITQFAETINLLTRQSNQNCKYFQEDEDFVTNGFGIQFPINIDDVIQPDILKAISTTEKLLHEAKTLLLQNLDTDVLTTFFSFPEHIKTACKQYLIYFGQFLMDLGIDADTEINEESDKTLFKVIPKNKGESLEIIKSALETYLNASEFENQNVSIMSNDIAVVQWQSNIMHLNSQLMLAQSALQLKDATIQSLQFSIIQYSNLLEKEYSKKESLVKDEEEIIKGIVSVNKFNGKGFSINLPEIVRKLKRKLL